jgi:SAM-dependent methyltransferase/DNA-directed RNA polymerase subunit RPC12/RpoP
MGEFCAADRGDEDMKGSALRCPVCSSQRVKEKPFGYRFNGKWLGGVRCSDCGIIFIHPQPTGEELKQLYSHEYFEGDYRCGHAGSYFDDQVVSTLQQHRLISRIKALKPSGEFLEIGCAGGAFLHEAQQNGYRVRGVEFSSEMAEFARQKFGLDVFAGELVDAKFPTGTFDVVFMGDVLEHIAEPVELLKEIHRVANEKALLVIAVPSQTNSLFSRVGFLVYSALGKKATVNLPPYHLFEYRPASLQTLLRSNGFKIVDIAQSIMSPKEIALRSSRFQNLAKRMFQYLNYSITAVWGIWGDRMEITAVKESGHGSLSQNQEYSYVERE